MSVDGLNYDNMFIRMLNRLGDAMILSLAFVLCCVPIFTIGASITALYYTAMKGISLDEGYVWKYFMKSFKQNFKQSTVMWLIFILLFTVFGVDLWFWVTQWKINAVEIAKPMIILSVVLLCFTIMTFIYAFPLQAKFDNKIFVQLRNALLMSVKYFPTTIMIVLITLVIAWVFYYQTIVSIIGFVMIGFGAVGYLYAFFMLRCFKPYIVTEHIPTPEELCDDVYMAQTMKEENKEENIENSSENNNQDNTEDE